MTGEVDLGRTGWMRYGIGGYAIKSTTYPPSMAGMTFQTHTRLLPAKTTSMPAPTGAGAVRNPHNYTHLPSLRYSVDTAYSFKVILNLYK